MFYSKLSLGKRISSGELLANLMARCSWLCLPTNAGWLEDVAGSGASDQAPPFLWVGTGITANSKALLWSSLFGVCPGVDQYAFNWDKKLYLLFSTIRNGSDAEVVARVQIKPINTEGELAGKGIGLRIDNFALVGESYGTALGTVNLGVTMADRILYQIAIIHYPGEKIEWWVDGVLKARQTATANIPSGTVSSSEIVKSIRNGATGGVAAYSYLCQPKIYLGIS